MVDCDISLGIIVNIIFMGNDSVNLFGLLVVDSSDMGIVIGFEILVGKLLYLN